MNNGNDTLISLFEFQRIARLSEAEILSMLAAGELAFEKGPNNELYIDVSAITPIQLANRSSFVGSRLNAEQTGLLEEMVASTVVAALEEIIDDAVELAVEWYMQKTKEHGEEPADAFSMIRDVSAEEPLADAPGDD